MSTARRWAAALGSILLAVAGCAVPGGAAPPDTPALSADPAAADLPPGVDPLGDYCAADPPGQAVQRVLPAGRGSELNSAWLTPAQPSATAVVLVPREDAEGMCGFLFFADYLATQGLTAVAYDPCGSGQSRCSGDPLARDPVAQVRVLADAARAAGASRVVVAGAERGGLVAAAATRSGLADAAVALSGPVRARGLSLATSLRRAEVPVLLAYGRQERAALAVAAPAAAGSGGRTVLVRARSGSGYRLLYTPAGAPTALAERIARFAAAR